MVAAAGAVAAVPGVSDELLAAESDLPAVDNMIEGEVVCSPNRSSCTSAISQPGRSVSSPVPARSSCADPALAGRLFHVSR